MESVPDRSRIRGLSDATLAAFRTWRGDRDSLERGRSRVGAELLQISRFLRSHFMPQAFERMVMPGGWPGYLASVFLAFRDRGAMLEYLRFQECAPDDRSVDDPLGAASRVLNHEMRQLGKRAYPLLAVVVHSGDGVRRRVRVPLDPFVTIRRMYLRTLKACRGRGVVGEGWRDRLDRMWLCMQIRLLRWIARRIAARGSIPRFGSSPNAVIREMFGPEVSWADHDWQEFDTEIERFAVQEAWPLLERTSESVWLTGGAGRFAKLAIGTLIGCAAARRAEGRVGPGAIAEVVRLSFYWALTYPLVDDVLDRRTSTPADRQRLEAAMLVALRGEPRSGHIESDDDAPITVAMRRLLDIRSVDRDRVATAIESVLAAHVDGARTRLDSSVQRGEIFIRLALEKSLLVRAATAEICGFRLHWSDYADMAPVAYFNQLGDDIWDAAEDFEDGSISPVTLWITGASREDPFVQYYDFGAWLAESSGSRSCARGVALAMVHTFSLAMAAGSVPADRLISVLGAGFDPESLRCVPHIDPDSMLFDFERLAVAEYLSAAELP